MMITRKTRWITVAVVLVVILLLLLWMWILFRPKVEGVQEIPVSDRPPEGVTIIEEKGLSLSEETLKKEQETRNQSAGATTIAKLFVERYGSYSNEANFQNLVDVLPLMTESFADETRSFITSAKIPETYYGISTSVLTVNVEAINESVGTSTILMQTQREVAEGSTQNVSVKYQEIRLKLIKEAGVWKVDSATWL